MAEEKKEEQKREAPATENAAEAPKQEAPAAAPEPQAAKAEAAAPQAAPASPAPAAAEKKEAAPVKKEKPATCVGCKKSIKKKRWYYRDGSYYCTKRCWTSAKKKAEKPQETAPAS